MQYTCCLLDNTKNRTKIYFILYFFFIRNTLCDPTRAENVKMHEIGKG